MTAGSRSLLAGWARFVARFLAIEAVGRLLYYSGMLYLIALVRRHVGPRRLLVPMYHRIEPSGGRSESALLEIEQGVPAELFDRQLRVLSWFGKFLTLDEAFDHLQSPARAPRTVIALTFDDGYRDNLTHALPVLERHHAAATLFPVVRTADGGRPLWWDELADVLRRGDPDCDELISCIRGFPDLPAAVADDEACHTSTLRPVAQALCDRLLPLPMQQRQRLLDELAGRLQVPTPSTSSGLYMDWEELAQMASAGCEIGGHTLDHPVLVAEDEPTREAQITGCRRELTERLHRPVRSFAMPNGAFDDATCRIIEQAGFRLAVTVEPGINTVDADPCRLKRVPVGNERPFHLALKLAFYGLVHR